MGELDKRQKQYFRDAKRFADLWNALMFDGEQVILPEELEEADSVQDFVGKNKTLERVADLIQKRHKNGEILAIMILENQTNDQGGGIMCKAIDDMLEAERIKTRKEVTREIQKLIMSERRRTERAKRKIEKQKQLLKEERKKTKDERRKNQEDREMLIKERQHSQMLEDEVVALRKKYVNSNQDKETKMCRAITELIEDGKREEKARADAAEERAKQAEAMANQEKEKANHLEQELEQLRKKLSLSQS